MAVAQHISALPLNLRLRKWLIDAFSLNETDVIVQKRNKALSAGDFLVLFLCHKSDPTPVDRDISIQINNDLSLSGKFYCRNGVYYISISRLSVFKDVIEQILFEGNKYGNIEPQAKRNIILSQSCSRPNLPQEIEDLRCSYVQNLLRSILFANGHGVTQVKDCHASSTDTKHRIELTDKVSNDLKHSKYCSGLSEDHGMDMNLQQVLDDNSFTVGKHGFDTALNTTKLHTVESQLQGVIDLEIMHSSTLMSLPHPVLSSQLIWFHVVPSRCTHKVQESILLHNVLHPRIYQHRLISCSSVKPTKSSKTNLLCTSEQLLSLRFQQAKEAFLSKYGQQVLGSDWVPTIQRLATATVTVELLSTSVNSPVCLDLSGSNNDPGGGIFIMYNCARLATMFQHFENGVKQGLYPELPPVDAINMSLLREEEEWELCFNFLLLYPSLISECGNVLQSEHLKANFPSHKICHYLHDLCRLFSSYYNRIHILGDPKPHLHQVMFTRLTLMKAVQQVLHNALKLLDITPLEQM